MVFRSILLFVAFLISKRNYAQDLNSSNGNQNTYPSIVYNITESNVQDFKTTTEITKYLVDLAKIWGVLKYKHPAVAKGTLDWDLQLFRSLNIVLEAKDKRQIEKHYTALLDSLGDFHTVFDTGNLDIKQPADYSWIDKLSYEQSLKNRLKKLQYTAVEKHHYFSFPPEGGEVKIINELSYPELDTPDVGFRLLALFRFWNIVQYFSPYRYLTDTPWNDVLAKYIPKMIEARSALQYQQTIMGMLTEMNDAHTQLWSSTPQLKSEYGDRGLPAVLKYVESKPIVTSLTNLNTHQTDLMVGDVILKKNGKTLQEIRDSLNHIIPKPNLAVADREFVYKLMRSKEEEVELLVDRDGNKKTLTVPTLTIPEIIFEQDTTAFKMLADDIAYINHEFFGVAHFLKHGEDLLKMKGIIIDMRTNGNDEVLYLLPALLLPNKTAFVKSTNTGYKYLGDFIFTEPRMIGIKNPHYFKGKVAILVDEESQSSLEYRTMSYQTAPKAKVFGSQTAGSDGNMSYFPLPGGLRSAISAIGVYYPDGRDTQRIGIVPDVKVKPTIKGMRSGKDEVLDKALGYINSTH